MQKSVKQLAFWSDAFKCRLHFFRREGEGGGSDSFSHYFLNYLVFVYFIWGGRTTYVPVLNTSHDLPLYISYIVLCSFFFSPANRVRFWSFQPLTPPTPRLFHPYKVFSQNWQDEKNQIHSLPAEKKNNLACFITLIKFSSSEFFDGRESYFLLFAPPISQYFGMIARFFFSSLLFPSFWPILIFLTNFM